MILVQLIVAFCAAVVLFNAFTALNRMTAKTHHGIRAAFVLIAAGAFGELMAIMQDEHIPGIAESLFFVGVGFLNFIDRRALVRCPYLPAGADLCPAPAAQEVVKHDPI